MEDVPEPDYGPNDLLIKIRKTAICGTDIHIYKWDDWAQKTVPVPMVVGHEFVREVAAIGSHVRGSKSETESGEGHITCGYCETVGRATTPLSQYCCGATRTGAFAEFLVIPAFNAFKIPDDIPDEIAAFFDLFGNAVHTALSYDLVGEDVPTWGPVQSGVCVLPFADTSGRGTLWSLTSILIVWSWREKMCISPSIHEVSPKEAMRQVGMKEGHDVDRSFRAQSPFNKC